MPVPPVSGLRSPACELRSDSCVDFVEGDVLDGVLGITALDGEAACSDVAAADALGPAVRAAAQRGGPTEHHPQRLAQCGGDVARPRVVADHEPRRA